MPPKEVLTTGADVQAASSAAVSTDRRRVNFICRSSFKALSTFWLASKPSGIPPLAPQRWHRRYVGRDAGGLHKLSALVAKAHPRYAQDGDTVLHRLKALTCMKRRPKT